MHDGGLGMRVYKVWIVLQFDWGIPTVEKVYFSEEEADLFISEQAGPHVGPHGLSVEEHLVERGEGMKKEDIANVKNSDSQFEKYGVYEFSIKPSHFRVGKYYRRMSFSSNTKKHSIYIVIMEDSSTDVLVYYQKSGVDHVDNSLLKVSEFGPGWIEISKEEHNSWIEKDRQ